MLTQKWKELLLAGAFMASLSAFADGEQAQVPPPPHHDAKFHAAFEACVASTGEIPVRGEGLSDTFKACLTKAGFPPPSAAFIQAARTCESQYQRHTTEFRDCMKAAGFEGRKTASTTTTNSTPTNNNSGATE